MKFKCVFGVAVPMPTPASGLARLDLIRSLLGGGVTAEQIDGSSGHYGHNRCNDIHVTITEAEARRHALAFAERCLNRVVLWPASAPHHDIAARAEVEAFSRSRYVHLGVLPESVACPPIELEYRLDGQLLLAEWARLGYPAQLYFTRAGELSAEPAACVATNVPGSFTSGVDAIVNTAACLDDRTLAAEPAVEPPGFGKLEWTPVRSS